MDKYYVFFVKSEKANSQILNQPSHASFNYNTNGINPESDALLIFVQQEQQIRVLPHIMKIKSVFKEDKRFHVKIEKTYGNDPLQNQELPIPHRTNGQNLVEIDRLRFEQIVRFLESSSFLSEVGMLAQVKQYIKAKGYYFEDEVLYNYHICLKTRPFVILAGLSGTGKSKLPQLYAEALGYSREHYLRLPVRSNWYDERPLLGYYNSISCEYIREPALDLFLQARAKKDELFFFCLDEMNLAHVEYYFSLFLSAMEEDDPSERKISLYSEHIGGRLEEAGIPPFISITPNIFIIGTINVDETTQSISDKVIDRANTLEFFEVDLDKVPRPTPLPEIAHIPLTLWQSYQASQPDTTYYSQIKQIIAILNKAHMGLGYRVPKEIGLYLANSKGLLALDVAFDLQIKQRILPRVRGSDSQDFRKVLEELISFTQDYELTRSASRLKEMKVRLDNHVYTSFWR